MQRKIKEFIPFQTGWETITKVMVISEPTARKKVEENVLKLTLEQCHNFKSILNIDILKEIGWVKK